jgi:hypothetical protein
LIGGSRLSAGATGPLWRVVIDRRAGQVGLAARAMGNSLLNELGKIKGRRAIRAFYANLDWGSTVGGDLSDE